MEKSDNNSKEIDYCFSDYREYMSSIVKIEDFLGPYMLELHRESSVGRCYHDNILECQLIKEEMETIVKTEEKKLTNDNLFASNRELWEEDSFHDFILDNSYTKTYNLDFQEEENIKLSKKNNPFDDENPNKMGWKLNSGGVTSIICLQEYYWTSSSGSCILVYFEEEPSIPVEVVIFWLLTSFESFSSGFNIGGILFEILANEERIIFQMGEKMLVTGRDAILSSIESLKASTWRKIMSIYYTSLVKPYQYGFSPCTSLLSICESYRSEIYYGDERPISKYEVLHFLESDNEKVFYNSENVTDFFLANTEILTVPITLGLPDTRTILVEDMTIRYIFSEDSVKIKAYTPSFYSDPHVEFPPGEGRGLGYFYSLLESAEESNSQEYKEDVMVKLNVKSLEEAKKILDSIL